MRVIDSHTGGEPTRLILNGGPDLGSGSLADRAARVQAEHGDFCASVLLEPRGHDAMVGALLLPPQDPACVAAVIYFNPAGALGMCGHATIGTLVTLYHLGRIDLGLHRLETPVGVVEVDLISPNRAVVENVASYRQSKSVTLDLPGLGGVIGDVAWGGNWFFLTPDCPVALEAANIAELTTAALTIRDALWAGGITGARGARIDHVEFISAPQSPQSHGRNFVLCPGGAYDRSPCGTGCSAKLACLAEDGLLEPGTAWIQESIIGSTYTLSYRRNGAGQVIPRIEGTAYVTADTTLIFTENDPYRSGIQL
ncbi:proline racemase family protein [Pseudophaeobacter arcticus]|uniref:4-hydroxyproline epimerase n=1 Tax=Pseudophaeobacter arcticus TaxID=385492 RepID=UPI0004221F50|nr:proline racemase family protein [Pseudophaeobacter arcticus]